MLAYSGFDVLQANGGATALVLARSEHPDIVLLDVMMPDLDGRDACRALKMDSDLRKIVVVLFSSADEEDVHWKGAGADAFLQKPFRIRELPDFLRGLLRE